jgi:hypothetical protein
VQNDTLKILFGIMFGAGILMIFALFGWMIEYSINNPVPSNHPDRTKLLTLRGTVILALIAMLGATVAGLTLSLM